MKSGDSRHVIRLFVAAPQDVTEERDRVERVARILNEPSGYADQQGCTLQVLDWHGVVPSMGLPEEVILDQLPVTAWDIFIGILWTRFGTPTGRSDPDTGEPFESGTEEEFKLALRSWKATKRPRVLFFRRVTSPPNLADIDPAQWARVHAFWQEFEPHGKHPGIVHEYSTPDAFQEQALNDLLKLLPGLGPNQADLVSADVAEAQEVEASTQTAYLQWLVRRHSTLELRGIRYAGQSPSIPLEGVFVALKGVSSSAQERLESRLLVEEEWREWQAQLDWNELSPEEQRALRWQFLARFPLMPTLEERDRPQVIEGDKSSSVTLADAFRQNRWLVVLGDPGTGKTTLARWLTRAFARALLKGHRQVLVPAGQVDAEASPADPPVDLGPARLPVLMRVADFATARRDNPGLSVADYLGFHGWLGEFPTNSSEDPLNPGERIPPKALNDLIKRHLRAGTAVVIFDGLDEITAADERDEVVRAIEQFTRDWIRTPDGQTSFDEPSPWLGLDPDEPATRGGNQLVVTSRRAGYHASPLGGRQTHVTLEPLGDKAIDRFCSSWMRAVHSLLANPSESGAEVQARASREAESLKAAIHDPARLGVRELAGYPLLLTILALVHHNSQARLPEQRVRLYQIIVENLIEVWRDTGLTEDEVVHVLAPLAAHIHEHEPKGLIEESEVRQFVTRELAAFRGVDRDNPPPTFRRDVDAFLRSLREQVGLLAARGEYLYGFLHLSFQEYLAARYLVRDPDTVHDEIVAHLGDPRWREPILLGLGYVSWTWGREARERLLHSLLRADEGLGQLVPQGCLLVAAALPELVHAPPGLVGETARILLDTSSSPSASRFQLLQEQIEEAFSQLRRGEIASVVDHVLQNVVTDVATAPHRALAAGRLMAKNGWFTPAVGPALLDALPYDSGADGWPIDSALQAIARSPSSATLDSRLSFRRALLNDSNVARRVAADPRLTALVLTVYGGTWTESSGLDASGIHRDSPVTPLMLEALETDDPGATLRGRLERAVNRAADGDETAREASSVPDFVLASLVLDEAGERILEHVMSHARPEVKEATLSRIGVALRGLESRNEAVANSLISLVQTAHDMVEEEDRQALLSYALKAEIGWGRSRTGLGGRIVPTLSPYLSQYPELLEDALTMALSLRGPFERDAVRQVLRGLDGRVDLAGRAVDIALSIGDMDFVSSVLTALGPALVSDGQLLLRALELSERVDGQPVLVALAQHTEDRDVLELILDRVSRMDQDEPPVAIFSTLAPRLGAHPDLVPILMRQIEALREDQRAEVLAALAPNLHRRSLVSIVLDEVEKFHRDEVKADVLAGLAPGLPSHPDLAVRVLDQVSQLGYEEAQGKVLRALVVRVGSNQDLASLLLDRIAQLEDDDARTLALRVFPGPLLARSSSLAARALEAARSARRPWNRAALLAHLKGALLDHPSLLQDAAAAALEVGSRGRRDPEDDAVADPDAHRDGTRLLLTEDSWHRLPPYELTTWHEFVDGPTRREVALQAVAALGILRGPRDTVAASVALAAHLDGELRRAAVRTAISAVPALLGSDPTGLALSFQSDLTALLTEGILPLVADDPDLLRELVDRVGELTNGIGKSWILAEISSSLGNRGDRHVLLGEAIDAWRGPRDAFLPEWEVFDQVTARLAAFPDLLTRMLRMEEMTRFPESQFLLPSVFEHLALHPDLVAEALDLLRRPGQTHFIPASWVPAVSGSTDLMERSLETLADFEESDRAGYLTVLAPAFVSDLAARDAALSLARGIERPDRRLAALRALGIEKEDEEYREAQAAIVLVARKLHSILGVQRTLSHLMSRFDLPTDMKQLWETLTDAPRREAALARLLERGADGLALTEAAARAIEALWDERHPSIPSLVALLEGRTASAVALARRWAGEAPPPLSTLGRLMQCESGTLDLEILGSLVELLKGANDRLRHRASVALYMRSGASRFRLTAVGPRTVEAVMRLHDTHRSDTAVSTILYWCLTQILHDDPESIETWIEAALAGGSESTALAVLSKIDQVTPDVWAALLAHLASQPPMIQEALLESATSILRSTILSGLWKSRIVVSEVVKGSGRSRIRVLLRDLATTDSEKVRVAAVNALGYLPDVKPGDLAVLQAALDGPPPVAREAATALARLAGAAPEMAMNLAESSLRARIAQADRVEREAFLGALARLYLTFQGSRTKVDESGPMSILPQLAASIDGPPEGAEVLRALLAAGTDLDPWDAYHEEVVKAAAALVEAQPELLEGLVLLLMQTASEASWPARRIALGVGAAAAARMPATFARATDPERFESSMVTACEDAWSYSVRRFALSILSHLRWVTPQVVRALRAGLVDVGRVSQDVIQSTARFRRVRGSLVQELEAGLADESAMIAYGTAELLAALGRSQDVDSASRQAIAESLQRAIADPRSRRRIYVLDEDAGIKDRGYLDEACFRALVQVTGTEGATGRKPPPAVAPPETAGWPPVLEAGPI